MEQPVVGLKAEQIRFPNGREARLVIAAGGESPLALIEALKVRKPKAVLLVCGGAGSMDPATAQRLELLFSRGIARAAIESGAAILDGGTEFGVMALIGKAIADREDDTTLIGVAPQSKVSYPGKAPVEGEDKSHPLDPNHTYFVLTPGAEYGSETATLFAVADALSLPPQQEAVARVRGLGVNIGSAVREQTKAAPKKLPVVTVLAGGSLDGVTVKEVLHTVRRGWPLIVIEGSGGLADELARVSRDRPEDILDPEVAEIVEEGNLYLASISRPPAVLRQQIQRLLGGNELLTLAWKRYGQYTTQARRHQGSFHNLQMWIIWLGVVTTFFVVVKSALRLPGAALLPPPFPRIAEAADPALYVVVLLLPIITSALIAIASRLNAGNKWVLLRSSAEAVKREIYLYRTRPASEPGPAAGVGTAGTGTAGADTAGAGTAGSITAASHAVSVIGDRQVEVVRVESVRPQGGAEQDDLELPSELLLKDQRVTSREIDLFRTLELIDQELMQSDVVTSGMPEYLGPIPSGSPAKRGDDGLSFLTPQRYIYLRLDEQLEYYRRSTGRMEKQSHRVQTLAVGVGALGTFLAAIGLELWVALSTSGVTALTAFLQYRQWENTLVRYNHAASNLDSIKLWWTSLTPDQQSNPINVRRLVETSEKVLESESRSWLQQMREALADLTKRPAGDADDEN